MGSIDILKLFWIGTIILWLFLFIVTLLMSSAGLLRKRGYSEEYISFIKRDYLVRAILIAVFVPVIQVAAFFITGIFMEDAASNVEIVALVFILMIIPFPFIDNYLTGRKLKSIKAGSNEIMVVDFKHKVLDLLYKPKLEMALAAITVVYALLVTRPVILFYLHIIFPWFIYLTARKSQKTSRPHLKDGYLWAFVFILINFALIIYYLIAAITLENSNLNSLQFSSGIVLVAVLMSRIIYYLINYPLARRKLDFK